MGWGTCGRNPPRDPSDGTGSRTVTVLVLFGITLVLLALVPMAVSGIATHADGEGSVAAIDGGDGLTGTSGAAPTAAFEWTPEEPEVGFFVWFDASDSTGHIEEYHWDFGDGETETTTDPEIQYSYDDPGMYTVELTVEALDGEDTIEQSVAVWETGFSMDPEEPIAGQSVEFDASESESPHGAIVEYRWDFTGDREIDVETPDPVTEWTYEEPGSGVAVLEVEDETGQIGQIGAEFPVMEPQPPTAAPPELVPDPPIALQPTTFDVSQSSSPNGEIVEYRWDFTGDGQFDEVTDEPIAEWTYEEPGGAFVQYELEDEVGETAINGAEFAVQEPEDPIAIFEWDPDSPIAHQPATFDASDSESPNGEIVEYRWDFTGDGEFDDEVTEEPIAEWTYEETGVKVANLEVEDEAGQTATTGAEFNVQEPEGPTAAFQWDPDQPTVGEAVTFDGSDSYSPNGEIVEYHWYFTGDGEADAVTEEPTVEWTFEESGVHLVGLEVVDEVDETGATGAEFNVQDDEAPVEPSAAFEWDPQTPAAGEEITFDASASTPDGEIVTYEWDFTGDGSIDASTGDPLATHTFDDVGSYAVELTVTTEDERTDTTQRTVRVGPEAPPEPIARCVLSATTVVVGEEVRIDASGSESADWFDFDLEGDGTVDVQGSTEPVVSTTFDEPGEYEPRVVVTDDLERQDEATCGVVTVEEAEDEDESIVPAPIRDNPELVIIGVITALGIGASTYFYGGGGSGSSGGDRPRPTPKPPKSGGGDEPARYETGVATVPAGGGPVSVTDVGFEPDLLVLTASACGGSARSAGWTQGVVVADGDDLEQFAFTVADDAESTERGTCGTSTGDAFELAVHGDRSLGTVQGSVTELTDDGFELVVRTTGSDAALDDDVTLLYRAFDAGTELEIDAGTFATPTAPGRQLVPLDVDASVVTLSTSTAVGEPGETWTTDRSIGVSMGAAVNPPAEAHAAETDGGHLAQASWATSVWPGRSNDAAARCGSDASLALCYQDGDRIAGRTTASITGLGERLELRFDRTYSGPSKIDPTGSHPVRYLAIDAGELTPAVGAVRLPAPGEELDVDCGFEPGLIEVTTSRSAALGHARHTGDVPFGWSTGTAIVRDGVLAQYALSGAGRVPEIGLDLEAVDPAKFAETEDSSVGGVEPAVATPGGASGAVEADLGAVPDHLTAGIDSSARKSGADDHEDPAEAVGDVLDDPSDVELTDGGTDEDEADDEPDETTQSIDSKAIRTPSKSIDRADLNVPTDADGEDPSPDVGEGMGVGGKDLSPDIGEGLDVSDGDLSPDIGEGLDVGDGDLSPDIGESLDVSDGDLSPDIGEGLDVGDGGLSPDIGEGTDIGGGDPTPNVDGLISGVGGDESPVPAGPDDGHVASTLAVDEDGEIVGRDEVRVGSVGQSGFTLAVEGLRVDDHSRGAEAGSYVWYRAWPALSDGDDSADEDELAGTEPADGARADEAATVSATGDAPVTDSETP